MMIPKHSHSHKVSRRKFLKKIKSGTKFIVPTLVSFNVSKLHATASVQPEIPLPPGEWENA